MIKGFIALTGDLLHPGHLALIEEAKSHCDYLIVGLNVNPCDRPFKQKPIESVAERCLRLRSCKWVDEMVCYDGEKDLELLTALLDFNIRFLGSDYINQEFTGKSICLAKGITVYYCNRSHGLSSTSLKERIKNDN